jgi:hypothetical protein
VIGHGDERLHEAWQQPEALDDYTRFPGEAEEVFDDQAEALALKPVERLKHGLRRSVHPSLVHIHSRELAQERGVLRRAPAGMVRHHVVGRVETQPVPSRNATGDGRLASTTPATDPVDVPELRTQRCGVGRSSVPFRSHPSASRMTAPHAAMLVAGVIAWAKHEGACQSRAVGARRQCQSRRFYERQGFWVTGRRRPFPGDHERFISEMSLRPRAGVTAGGAGQHCEQRT